MPIQTQVFKTKKITDCSKIRFFSKKKFSIFFSASGENIQSSFSKHDYRIDFFFFSAHFGFLGSRPIDILESGSAPVSGDHTNIHIAR
jgi:hypothetical protein